MCTCETVNTTAFANCSVHSIEWPAPTVATGSTTIAPDSYSLTFIRPGATAPETVALTDLFYQSALLPPVCDLWRARLPFQTPCRHV